MSFRIAAGIGFLLASASGASAALRLFLSPVGVADLAPLSAAQVPVPRTNPVVAPGTRLYIWAEMSGPPDAQRWNGIDFDVQVEGGSVAGISLYNYAAQDPDTGDFNYRRWQAWGPAVLVALMYGEGVNNRESAAESDLQSEIGVLGPLDPTARELPKATLIGAVDLTLAPGATHADVFLRVGRGGITRAGANHPGAIDGRIGNDAVYFGVGDENPLLHGGGIGHGSARPDATIWSTTISGACCLPSGACETRAAFVCAAAGGHFGGANSACETCSGACCMATSCAVLSVAGCAAGGGAYAGVATDCAAGACYRACCFAEGVCRVLSETQCAAAGGASLGAGGSCIAQPCPGRRCDGFNGIRGDANCDGAINGFDIDSMVAALVYGFDAGAAMPEWYSNIGGTPGCWELRRCWGDIDGNERFNNFDIDPFVNCILNTPPPGIGCGVGLLRGDANCDGAVNNLDIDFFVTALIHITEYPPDWAALGGTQACWQNWRYWGDVDGDGVSLPLRWDIDAMAACLANPPAPGHDCFDN